MKLFVSARVVVLSYAFALVALAAMETSAHAQAASDFTTMSDGGTGLIITGYNGTITAVVIPATINGQNVTAIGNNAFEGLSSLTSVTIPANVTSLGSAAFFDCSALANVNIPNGVTSIGNNVFEGCSSLTSVALPSTVTSIGSAAFFDCSALTYLNIPSGVTSLATNVFEGCSSLTNVTIPSTVTSLGNGAFFDCSDLTNVIIPSGVSSLGMDVFEGCNSLTSVAIPSSVTSIGKGAFFDCSDLTNVIIPTGVTSLGMDAFEGCSSLTNVTIPSSVTSIGAGAFFLCSAMTDAFFVGNAPAMGGNVFESVASGFKVYYNTDATGFTPGSGTWTADANDSYPSVVITYTTVSDAHGGVIITGFTSGTLPPNTLVTPTTIGGKNVTGIGSSAFASTGDANVVISPGVTTIGSFAFQFSTVSNITLPNGVTTLGEGVFDFATHLNSIIFPASVTSIGAGAFQFATSFNTATFNGPAPTMGSGVFNGTDLNVVIYFNNATGFQSGTWTDSSGDQYPAADFGTSVANNQVTITSYAGPNVITIPAIVNGLPVTTLGLDAFAFPTIVTSVTIPYGVTTIGNDALANFSLTSVTIPNSVTSIGEDAFNDSSGLTSITIPNSVTTIGEAAFTYCTGLTSATIPDSVTSLGAEAFLGCTGLTSANIPAGVASIGESPFGGCTQLTAFTVDPNNPDFMSTSDGLLVSKDQTLLINYPAGKTNTSYTIPSTVTTIGQEAFFNSPSLTSVTIPNHVTNIDKDAFAFCSGLTGITIPASVTSLGEFAFEQCTALSSATFNGNSPTLGGNVFFQPANNFTVKYYDGAVGFPASSGTWTPDANDSYPAVDLGGAAFSTWLSFHSGVTDTSKTGTPQHDGIPNLLKYIFDIDPTRPMTGADLAGLPLTGQTTSGGKTFLTLKFGEYVSVTGVTMNVQTSTDLVHWTTLAFTTGTPTASQYAEADTGTNDPNGDPYVQVKVLSTSTHQFLRLDVTSP